MKRFVTLFATAAMIMAAVACSREPRLNGGGGNGGYNGGGNGGYVPTEGMPSEYKLRNDWRVDYLGREDHDQFGRAELLEIEVPGAKWFVIRTITPENYQDLYKSKVADFIEAEISGLRDIAAEAREVVTNYCEEPAEGAVRYAFPWMFHGDMITFVIGITDKGWPSGDYCFSQYTIEEDEADETFPKWLGNWRIGDEGVGYKINVTSAEQNLAYDIAGWETGSSISETNGTVMDQESLLTYYDGKTGNMDFISLYISTYNDTDLGGYVDEYFIGRIKDKSGDWWDLLSEEDVLAVAKLSDDGNSATVTGAPIKTELDGTLYTGNFAKMQYVCVDGQGKVWLYNDNVPAFPLSMTKAAPAGEGPTSLRGVRSSKRPAVVRNHPIGSTSKEARSTRRCSPSSTQ